MLRNLVFFCSILLSFLVNKVDAQIFIPPNNSFGTSLHRVNIDSTFYFPTGCGTPSDTLFLFSQGFNGKGEKKKMAAKYYDSCGHHEYVWDPALKAWHITDGGGGTGGNANTKIGPGYWQVDGSTNNVKTWLITGGTLDSITSGALRITIPVLTADETTLHKTGNVFSINSTYPGQSSINTLGTVVAGIWQSTAIADPYIASANTWNAKQTSVLTSAKIWIGNGSNVAVERVPSGDLTINNTGTFTLANTITAGSCTNCDLTFDSKGRLVAAGNGTSGGGGGNPFPDNVAIVKNNADNTRQVILAADLISTSTTRTIKSPNANGIIVLNDNTATLTNKTIDAGSNTITGLTNSNLSGAAGVTLANFASMSPGFVIGRISGTGVPTYISFAALAAAMPASNLFMRNLGGLGDSLVYTINDSTFGVRKLNFNSDFAIGRPSDSSLTYALSTTGVTAGSYTNANFTVDAKGRILTATNGSSPLIDPTTTAWDIMGRDATNTLVRFAKGPDGTSWGFQGGIGGYYSSTIWRRTTITTGTSTTFPSSNYMYVFDPSSVIASYTITTPSSPIDNQMIGITAGGSSIPTGTVITSLTVSPNTGQTFIGSTPTTLAAGQTYAWYYRVATQTWYPFTQPGGSGSVISVSGTGSRITSTGGANPQIDISSTFEALIGKVAQRIDQNNASTTSTQLFSTISDETGTGVLVGSASPAFTGNPTVPNQPALNSSTRIANTKYVDDAVAAAGSGFTPTSSAGTVTIAGSNFEVSRPNLRPTTTVSSGTTMSLSSGDYVKSIWVDPTSTTTNFQVGTTSTGSDVVANVNLIAGSKNNFTVNYRATGSVTLYFQNISSSTVITLIKEQ